LYEYFNSKNLIKFPFDKTKLEDKINGDDEDDNKNVVDCKNKQQQKN